MKVIEMSKTNRQAYEEWQSNRYVTAFDRNPKGTWGDENGERYASPMVQAGWEAWQAATTHCQKLTALPNELVELSRKATPGEWSATPVHSGQVGMDSFVTPADWDGRNTINGHPTLPILTDFVSNGLSFDNAVLIAKAVNYIRFLETKMFKD